MRIYLIVLLAIIYRFSYAQVDESYINDNLKNKIIVCGSYINYRTYKKAYKKVHTKRVSTNGITKENVHTKRI